MSDSKDGPLGYGGLTSLLPWVHGDKTAKRKKKSVQSTRHKLLISLPYLANTIL